MTFTYAAARAYAGPQRRGPLTRLLEDERWLADLGRADIRLAMPNPDTEGVTDQIKLSLKKAGGDALAARAEAYTPGETDLAWTRIRPWRSMLAAA